jgi:DNA-binding NarL/FixJ family response regulator
MQISLLLVDDHAVVRQGVAAILKDAEITVVDEAETGSQAIERARIRQPDVVLLDVRLPDMDGLTVAGEIRDCSPRTKVVMFTAYDSPTYIARAVAMGASGYLLKGASKEEIVEVITCAHHGAISEIDMAVNKIRNTVRFRLREEEVPITSREIQVLRHVALGLSNREIGRTLEISPETVKQHVQSILRKLEVADRTEAAVWAVRRGLV